MEGRGEKEARETTAVGGAGRNSLGRSALTRVVHAVLDTKGRHSIDGQMPRIASKVSSSAGTAEGKFPPQKHSVALWGAGVDAGAKWSFRIASNERSLSSRAHFSFTS